ncbi:MAG: hypothetical protein DA328_04585 [Nitrososphaeraceae archaeon]|nr:hypothetical protein [Nitrososphaeraceae archaeon]
MLHNYENGRYSIKFDRNELLKIIHYEWINSFFLTKLSKNLAMQQIKVLVKTLPEVLEQE